MSSLSPNRPWVPPDPETAALIEKNLGEDPAQLALRLKCDREQAHLVCRQVKYLQRAKSKLPSYYEARCILPPLSYEQCSSEAAAAMKFYSGRLCIDLTGGLGVDSFYFSKSFDRVITIERDSALADIARHNFARLGAENITVENKTAEDFLAHYDGPAAELIYVDPARRRAAERVFLPEDCSPNVLELLPLLLQKGKKVLIKLSPLFDADEALRVFAPRVSKVEIVSVGGEVKELLVELIRHPEETKVVVSLSGEKTFTFAVHDIPEAKKETFSDAVLPRFLLIPDAAFYKARRIDSLLDRYYPRQNIFLPAPNGFAFAEKEPEGFPGRIYRILEMEEYQPKQLKKKLKKEGIKRINILRRDFPDKSEEIKQALNLREGGTAWFAFTKIDGKAMVFRTEPVK